jgi:hypothetical protein
MDVTVASTVGRGAGDRAVPPGWRANPSAWAERLPIAGAALVGFAIAAYLTLFQLGVLDRVWEPLFGDMPWIVMVFGIAVGPLGATSVLLVIAQPVLYHSWCTLCLASAVISVAMIGPAVDEVLPASSTCAGCGGPAARSGGRSGGWAEMWPRLLTVAVGIWLMAAPAVLGYAGTPATSDRIAGPVVAAIGIVAASTVTRGLRWANLAPGLWLVAGPALLGSPAAALVSSGGWRSLLD